jgi:hypothetical protein
VLLTLMKLSFETVNSFFGLIDDVFLKGTVDDATQMMSGEVILVRARLTRVDWSGKSRTTWLCGMTMTFNISTISSGRNVYRIVTTHR